MHGRNSGSISVFRFETRDGSEVPCMVINARHRRLGDSNRFAVDEHVRLPTGHTIWMPRGGHDFVGGRFKPYTEKYSEAESKELAESIRHASHLFNEYVTFVCLPDKATVRSLIVTSNGERKIFHEAQYNHAHTTAVAAAIDYARNGATATITESSDVNAVRPYGSFISEDYVKRWMKQYAHQRLAVVIEETQGGIYSCVPAIIDEIVPRLGRIYLKSPPIHQLSCAFYFSGKHCRHPKGQTRMLPPASSIAKYVLSLDYHDVWMQNYGHLLDALRHQEQIPFDEVAAFGVRAVRRPWLAFHR